MPNEFKPSPNLRGFAEKVAVVSDGANPFGRAVALALALSGCYVVAGFAENSVETRRALTELQSIGTLANAVAADAATENGVAQLFEFVGQTYGRLDMLVNTALFEPPADFAGTSANDFEEIISRNLKAAFFSAQHAVLLMKNRPNASIVNFAAEAVGKPLSAVVCAATIGLTEALADQLAPGVRVNCVAWKASANAADNSEISLLRQPSTVAPDDAARAAVYLLSPEAAAVTGQTVRLAAKRPKI